MAKNWYPVINTETCTQCGECIQFCKHGVYDKEKGNTPVVINPDGCIDHCHGCGGLCPTGSITYFGEDTGWTPPNGKADESGECSCGGGCDCGEGPVPVQKSSSCCSPASSCCSGADTSCGCSPDVDLPKKEITIDFLYLDLSICERCIATGDTLDEALRVMAPVFETLNYSVTVNKVNITTEELAVQHRFISSPTIRVNGIDICNELVENECENCGDLAGCSVDCRVFVYEGMEYTQPPTAAIVDGILRVLYGGKTQAEQTPYELPENLINYFKGRESMMKTMSIYEPAMCCPTGLCGVGVDPELMRISTVLDTLKKNGITVNRYNLTSFPQEFVKNAKVNERLMDEGVEVLPIIVVDGKVVITKRYPSNGEFVKLLDLPKGVLDDGEPAKADESSCCCGGDSKGKSRCC